MLEVSTTEHTKLTELIPRQASVSSVLSATQQRTQASTTDPPFSVYSVSSVFDKKRMLEVSTTEHTEDTESCSSSETSGLRCTVHWSGGH